MGEPSRVWAKRALFTGALAAALLVPAATSSAQYTGTKGPNAGPNSGPGVPVQVLGQTFTRGPNGDILASTGAEIAELVLVGGGSVAVGVVLVRRSRRRTA